MELIFDMDISSGNGYPESALSNFAPHPFIMDEVECASMEGFLQSLKFKNPEMQVHVCTLVGKAAKFKGKNKNWWKTQTLWWKGKPVPRDSMQYQGLLNEAFLALSKNSGFKKALLSTKNANLTHSIGKKDSTKTILTGQEFCSRLMMIRKLLVKEQNE